MHALPASSPDALRETRQYTTSLQVLSRQPKDAGLGLTEQFRLTKNKQEQVGATTIVSLVRGLLERLILEGPPDAPIEELHQLQREVQVFVKQSLPSQGKDSSTTSRQHEEALFVIHTLFHALQERLTVLASANPTPNPAQDLDALLEKKVKLLNQDDIITLNHIRQTFFFQRKLIRKMARMVRLIEAQGQAEKAFVQSGGHFLSLDEDRQILRTYCNEQSSLEEFAINTQCTKLAKLIGKGFDCRESINCFFREAFRLSKLGIVRASLIDAIQQKLQFQQVALDLKQNHDAFLQYLQIFMEIKKRFDCKFPAESDVGIAFLQQTELIGRWVAFSQIASCRKLFLESLARSKGQGAIDPALINAAILHAEEKRIPFITDLKKRLGELSRSLTYQLEPYTKIAARFKELARTGKYSKLYVAHELDSVKICYKKLINGALKTEKRIIKLSVKDLEHMLEKAKSDLCALEITLIDQIRASVLAEEKEAASMPSPPSVSDLEAHMAKAVLQEPVQAVLEQLPQAKPEPKKILYHERVLRWLRPDPLTDPFTYDSKYKNVSNPDAMLWIIAQHSFASAVDAYAIQYGQKRANSLAIVGEMSIGSVTRKGLFTYGFDDEGSCYHRYFTIKKLSELDQEYAARGFYELDFPPLENSRRGKHCKASSPHFDDQSKVSSETMYIATILDPKNQATIRLCKISDA